MRPETTTEGLRKQEFTPHTRFRGYGPGERGDAEEYQTGPSGKPNSAGTPGWKPCPALNPGNAGSDPPTEAAV